LKGKHGIKTCNISQTGAKHRIENRKIISEVIPLPRREGEKNQNAQRFCQY
jgi:hypothetical protein